MATYSRGAIPSEGIIHVLVNGIFVAQNQIVQKNVFPGRPMRSNLYYQNLGQSVGKKDKIEL